MGQEIAEPDAVHQDVDRFSLRSTLLVPASAEEAFAAFANLTNWWVPEFTWSGPDFLAELGFEPRPGGMLYEIGPHGFRSDWGRVLTWEPPHRLVFVWQIGPDRVPVPDPSRASEVEVLFGADGSGRTRVTVEHRKFDRHGAAAEGYRQAMTEGWQDMLTRYLHSVRRRPHQA
ncbi:SRPBCC family protein [Micromonospora sp. NPDC050187]|uniref:SRPBCC family protein n=1 Tax=Micromonospora sp. NPDC050187 TaxID=3364277 RepID=UPI0037A4E4BB